MKNKYLLSLAIIVFGYFFLVYFSKNAYAFYPIKLPTFQKPTVIVPTIKPIKPPKWYLWPKRTPTPTPTCIPTPTSTPTPTPIVKRVFVTSSTFGGDLVGCQGANTKCQMHADRVALGGTWTAWCQDDTTLAKDKITVAEGGYKRVDGAIIADSFANLISGNLQNSISADENGLYVASGVWTGTQPNPNYYSVTCLNWTAFHESYAWGSQGCSNSNTIQWTDCGWAGCNNQGHIYCFEN